MMNQPVNSGNSHHGISEDVIPLTKGLIGGDKETIALVAMEEHLVSYGVTETQRLGSVMAASEITACLDETFHPEVCLVGIEPVSNFILVETYSERRDAESWEESLNAALTGLPVTIRQVTSDAASGLLRYAQEILGVPHSPDLFHIQRELVRATAWPLAQQHRHAQKAVAQAESEVARATAKRERYQRRPCPGRRPSFEVAIERAELALANAQQALVTVEQHQEQAQAAIQRPFILVSTDGTLSGPEVIAAYGLRFKIELTFRTLIHLLGGFAYRFWLKAMTTAPSWPKNLNLADYPESVQGQILAKVDAMERFVNLNAIALGILQPTFRTFNWHSEN